MTATEIASFILNNNPADREKFTRIILKTDLIFIGHFLMQHQQEKLMKENKWILIQGGSNARIDINGNDIKLIKEN